MKLKRNQRVALNLQSRSLKVGWTKESTARYPDQENVSTAQVAEIHDKGLGVQTRKNFLENGVKSIDRGVVKKVMKSGLINQDNMGLAGLAAVNSIRAAIREIDLIDTGLLRQSAGYEKQ